MRSIERKNQRSGFTLTEMLVVITIIMILVGLLAVSVSGVMRRGKQAVVVADIQQLSTAIGNFKGEFGQAPPTYLVLAGNYNTARSSPPANLIQNLNGFTGVGRPFNDNTALMSAMLQESETFLKKMFPRWNPSPGAGHNGLPVGPAGGVEVLSGSQVLYFLLGGYSVNGNTGGNRPYNATASGLGFSDDPLWPFGNPTGSAALNRKKPLFDFNPSNLVAVGQVGLNSQAQSPFPAYKDAYGTPYAYMAAKNSEDYAFEFTTASAFNYVPTIGNPLGGECRVRPLRKDGTVFSMNVAPYMQRIGTGWRYINPSGYQIISAGNDGFYRINAVDDTNPGGFGPGGRWVPGQGAYVQGRQTDGAARINGYDDIANFHPRLLGIP